MARRKTAEARTEESLTPPAQQPESGVQTPTASNAMPQERQPGEEPGESKKQWAKRPDPFPSHGYYWQDGYKIGYQESERNREAQIKFGSGGKDDQPKNFEEIKAFLKEHGLHWTAEDKAWGRRLRNRFDAQTREEVEGLLKQVVALEEKQRGPSAGTLAEERERGF